jgi:hypothetical protein
MSYTQNIVPMLIPSYGPSYFRVSLEQRGMYCETYMINDVTHENIWNSLDLALIVDSIIISYNSHELRSGKLFMLLTRTRDGVPRGNNVNLPMRVRKPNNSTRNDRNDICN